MCTTAITQSYLSWGLEKQVEIYTVCTGGSDGHLFKFSLGCLPNKCYIIGSCVSFSGIILVSIFFYTLKN
jgi:hypothetical protein